MEIKNANIGFTQIRNHFGGSGILAEFSLKSVYWLE